MASRDAADPGPEATQRLDKWLWFARVVKTRTLASGLVEGGKVRINRARVDKPSHAVKVGDVVTVTAHQQVRVLKVLAPGDRRGPATEARKLFDDLTPPAAGKTHDSGTPMGETGAAAAPEAASPEAIQRAEEHGPSPEPPARPDKHARRALIALKRR